MAEYVPVEKGESFAKRQPIAIALTAAVLANLVVRGLLEWGVTLTDGQADWIEDVVLYVSAAASAAWAWLRVQPVKRVS